jgi:uncharacterized phage-associated protein
MIKFKYNEAKTTQVAALFLKKNGGKMNYMKLIKLLYLVDRDGLARWGRPLTGDSYFSMKKGPILSNVLDLINYGTFIYRDSYWYKFISEPKYYNISLQNDPGSDELSKRELALIDEIFEAHKKSDQWKMVDFCHNNLPEWEHPGDTSIPIRIEDILKALDKTEKEIEIIEEEALNLEHIQSILSDD